jgi:hypothetical protein
MTPALLSAVTIFTPLMVLRAHNPCCTVASKGVPGAVITLDGVASAGEWTGAGAPIAVGAGPLNGSITLLHKADGIYFLAVITDATNNNSDAFNIRFDIDHSGGGAPDADDFGVVITRDGQAHWGPANQNPNMWPNVPAGNVGVTSGGGSWTVEFHLPTGPPSNLSLATGTIGVYFNFYDADNAFGPNSAKYAQWPPAPLGDPNALLDQNPGQWADLVFDPKTTFPDVSVLNVRRGDAGPANYNNIDYQGVNSFEAELANPGGTAINDAANVRINLYLAAVGIGESWHRLDTNAVLTADCGLATWPSLVVAQTDVCMGAAPLPDISTMTIANVVANTAKYTIQNGLTMNRTGGNTVTIPGVSDTYYPVIDWNTTPAQDAFFQSVVVSGTTYDRAHECMLAEAIVPNDPNPGNNTVYVNMRFVGVPFTNFLRTHFSLGWPGFAKYDPNVGKAMYLQVNRRNMDERFQFELAGAKQVAGNTYVAELKGAASLDLNAGIKASAPDIFGKTLKENLMVPPKAGGTVLKPRSGVAPVWVKVPPNSDLWIVNYSLDDKDVQYVDMDGKGPLPHNGPAGLPRGRVRRPEDDAKVVSRQRPLLVPRANLGELVLSFDGFKTGIGIAEGVQIHVPPNVGFLALAINGYAGGYNNIAGTGFRVKIIVRPPNMPVELPAVEIVRAAITPAAAAPATAAVAAPATVGAAVNQPAPGQLVGSIVEGNQYHPISIVNVIPQVCVAGYEDSGQKRAISGTANELFRYIGDVCWGISNIVQEYNPKPDRPDPAPQQ